MLRVETISNHVLYLYDSHSIFVQYDIMQQITSKCQTCRGEGAIECSGCKGTGKNKKNGNIFERWKCFECQGFGLKSCPVCGKGGLTPEQRGER
ncbi:EMBRYO SAC DEVELOPMENT ARREST 3, chloroplastic isoform X1 [Olea europaea subsp. europaea]|uniref:EMBRYO SAC DEVELOPMENT ARREST 3, chloroplastic isoform X1 n=1 Tax=Olea europaea subsp. europaea TaxID=158383 RepID=A0A8S0U1H0_OLEEU|nr:EMBRYO SAC DEVELOPMENT ARREST 3, chloroplastic isoform X1 [Olea europaea subsp. europaea]